MPKGVYKHHKQSKETIAKRSKAMLGKNKLPREIRICVCGCEGIFECIVTSKQRFIYGHNRRGKSCRASAWSKGLTKKTSKIVAKHSVAMKKHWADPEAREKHLKAIFKGLKLLPNKPEKFLIKLLQELFPNQWKYVGDGKDVDSFIAGKCPDFIDIDQKKIIEHFGEYNHSQDVTGISNELHEQERIDLFARQDYQTLIIWGRELKNVPLLENKLQEFCNV